MVIDTAPAVTGTQLGYARVSTAHQSLDQQMDALTASGVDAARVYTDKLPGTSTRQQRPGLAALLDYSREGDAIVVVGIDRLGRNAAEVMTTIRDLGERGIVLRSIREGIDTICEALDIQYKIEQVGAFDPVTFDVGCVKAIRDAADRLGYSHRNIVSGAGHDACWINRVAPTAMVMCPCVDGVSHNEAEEITKEWASAGADVLFHAVVETAGIGE